MKPRSVNAIAALRLLKVRAKQHQPDNANIRASLFCDLERGRPEDIHTNRGPVALQNPAIWPSIPFRPSSAFGACESYVLRICNWQNL
jgi:hypothetical protein